MDNINPYQAPSETIEEAFNDLPPLDRDSIEYASRWLRLGGVLIDGLCTGPIVLAIGYFGVPMVFQTVLHEKTSFAEIYPTLLVMAVFWALNVPLIYSRGQTIGKMICGTVVVNKDDFRQVSGNRYVFRRELPIVFINNIPVIGGLIGIADALSIFRTEKNCLHDDIAGTRVIMRQDLMRLQNLNDK